MQRRVAFSPSLHAKLNERAQRDTISRTQVTNVLLAQGLDDPAVREVGIHLLDDARLQERVDPKLNVPVEVDLINRAEELAGIWSSTRSVRYGQIIAALLWQQLAPQSVRADADADRARATTQVQQSVGISMSRDLNTVLLAEARRQRLSREALVDDWLRGQLELLDAARAQGQPASTWPGVQTPLSPTTSTLRVSRQVDVQLRDAVTYWSGDGAALSKRGVTEMLLVQALAAHSVQRPLFVSPELYTQLEALVQTMRAQGSSVDSLAEVYLRRGLKNER